VTVIYECGAGATRSMWALIQSPVAQFARSIVYDRAGVGKSPPDSVRTMARMADDLCDVIDHFMGTETNADRGASSRLILAASLRPSVVSALVLLDPTDEGVDALFAPSFRFMERVSLYAALGLSYTGLIRPLASYTMKWMIDMLPPDVAADLALETNSTLIRTQMQASQTFLDEVKALRDHPPKIEEHVPVTIISGALTGFGMPEKTRAEINAAHAVQAGNYTLGRHVLAEHSGHMVPFTDVQLVVDEIKRLA
jgi:pimeloyl-ACP methyl ester carboxylesterase